MSAELHHLNAGGLQRAMVPGAKTAKVRHFLDLDQLPAATLEAILAQGRAFKGANRMAHAEMLRGRALAMIFEKPSTRTRISFELGISELGGKPIVLTAAEMQLGQGETLADTARVLSRYVHAVMLRTSDHARLEELARHASIPIINGLSDRSHPCQVLTDLMTVREHLDLPWPAMTVAWVGDCNNVAASWMQAAAVFGFALNVAAPPALRPDTARIRALEAAGARLRFFEDPAAAAGGADVVTTDTWVSMNHVDGERRRKLLAAYRVDAAVMAQAQRHAIFLHCLPAHRGEEVTDEVIDGAQSAVWDEAENRLHLQKAVLAWCLGRIG